MEEERKENKEEGMVKRKGNRKSVERKEKDRREDARRDGEMEERKV